MEASISTTTTDTRSELLRTARRLFAERGFYGTSIASIATELGLTKQALIHHFKTKEQLYAEVLARLADELATLVANAQATSPEPDQQLEELMVRVSRNASKNPEDIRLLMRELLDNPARAREAHTWYLKDFLDSVVAIARSIPGSKLTETEALGRLYPVFGAIQYFVVSQTTLEHMYGKRALQALNEQFPLDVQRLVRASFQRGA